MSKKEIVIIIILIAIGFLRFLFFIPKVPDFGSVINKEVTFIGVVDNDPDVRLKNQHLNVKIENQNATILVIADRSLDISYGDLVKVKGILEEPENFITNTGKEFNYKRYLSNQDIYFMIKKADIEVISHNHGNQIKSILYKVRNAFTKNINKVIPVPESDLAGGLVLGLRGGFDDEMNQDFVETGTIHIVALSGYNVSIVSDNVMKVFSFIFSQTVSILLGVFVIILFIIMTGISATSVRAGIMATIMLLGRMTGRKYLAGRALVIAALLMTAYDPRVLTDMSFQLSFVATFGVLFITPKVFKWFSFLPIRFGIREMAGTTTAATIAVLPIILHATGVLSLVSIPTNILILGFLPTAMLFIFLTGMFGFIFHPLALIAGYASYIILLYVLSVIHFFGNLSFASVTIHSFPLTLTITLYVLILWWVFRKGSSD